MRWSSAALSVGLLLSSAAVASPRSTPTLDLPATYRNADLAPSAAHTAVTDRWWQSFGDAQLDRMVETALAGNLDIAAAAARLEAASAGARAARGARLPAIGLDGSAGIQQLSVEDQQGQLTSGIPGFERTVERYGLNGAASWEVDLFGRLSAGQRAAVERREAAASEVAGARLTIAAEVCTTYIAARSLQARLAVAEERVRALEDLDRLVALQVTRGVAAAADSDQSKAELAIARAAVPALRAALEIAYNRLDVLMGRAPGRAASDMGTGPVPAAPVPEVADGPASLLTRRPDVVAAERLVAASDADVAAAIAAKYPSLTLSGFAGFLANGLANLFTGGALQLGAEAGISAPLFQGGRLRAQEDAARGRLDEAIAIYRETAIRAVADVEDALSAVSRRCAQAAQLDAAQQALTVANKRALAAYGAGSISLIDEITVRRRRQDAEDQAIIAHAEASSAAVALFRGLGGGWKAKD